MQLRGDLFGVGRYDRTIRPVRNMSHTTFVEMQFFVAQVLDVVSITPGRGGVGVGGGGVIRSHLCRDMPLVFNKVEPNLHHNVQCKMTHLSQTTLVVLDVVSISRGGGGGGEITSFSFGYRTCRWYSRKWSQTYTTVFH